MGLKNLLVSAVNNPKLLVGVGIGLFISAGVTACVQTLKVEKILDDQNAKLDEITENHTEEELQLPEVKKEMGVVRAKTVGRLVLNYAAPVAMAGMAAWAICRAYGLQRQAYLAMSAAYGTIAKAYDAVLDRVEKKWGVEGRKYAQYGIDEQEREIEVTDEKGKKKKEKVKENVATERWEDMKKSSPNIIIFDEETSLYKEYGGSMVHMRSELVAGQNYMNVQYNTGVPIMYNADIVKNFCGNDARWMTDAGQVLGCYKGDPDNRAAINDCVDLGIDTFVGTDPETGEPKTYIYIDPKVALVNLDANKSLYPTGTLQEHNLKKRVGGKYISQVA